MWIPHIQPLIIQTWSWPHTSTDIPQHNTHLMWWNFRECLLELIVKLLFPFTTSSEYGGITGENMKTVVSTITNLDGNWDQPWTPSLPLAPSCFHPNTTGLLSTRATPSPLCLTHGIGVPAVSTMLFPILYTLFPNHFVSCKAAMTTLSTLLQLDQSSIFCIDYFITLSSCLYWRDLQHLIMNKHFNMPDTTQNLVFALF